MNKMNKVKITGLKINHFNQINNLLRVPNLLNRLKMWYNKFIIKNSFILKIIKLFIFNLIV